MTSMSKFAIIAAVAAVSMASPAFAQSFDPEVGSGNVLPFNYAPNDVQPGKVAVLHGSHSKIAARQNGLHAFAMVPRTHTLFDSTVGNSYSPSSGYDPGIANQR
jgi:hypothetical protein